MAKTIPAEEKVFMVSKSTNTTYSGSAALKAMNEWYTMADVANTVQPYKVFTALLTQSGGDEQSDKNGGDDIFKGVTYYINVNDDNGDFTIYGSPNNNVGTYFICNQNGVVPTGAQLLYNGGAPVATVLENTIGNVWFTYNGTGSYIINSNNLFIDNKSMAIIGTPMETVSNSNFAGIVPNGPTQFLIDVVEPAGTSINDLLSKTPIEIRVYN